MNARPDPSKMGELQSLDGPNPQGWMIVISKGQHEKSVRDRLIAQGFEVYLPFRLLPPDKAMRRGLVAVPLFPRYLFARATLDADRWQAIFSTIGVQRVLCDPAQPRGIRPQFVDAIRSREVDGFLRVGLIDPTKPPPKPAEKDHRKWRKLTDLVDGLLAEPVDDHRKSVLVSLLNSGHAALTQPIRKR